MFVNKIINFGFWKKTKYSHICFEDRFKSENELYREVAKMLNIKNEDILLEVGCGFGLGAALIINEFSPMKIKGVDISKERIESAKEINNLSFGLIPLCTN